jgi:pimeloyl-ACP methyl ester carboxylesterase
MAEPSETVILIHGLWMPGIVLLPMQRRLRAAGFAVRRFSYPSWRDGLAANVDRLARCVAQTPGTVIHLVAHSLGGLLTLSLLAQQPDARIGRVVMLGTPCAGCHCGFTLAAIPLLAKVVGRTFVDWFRLPQAALPPRPEIGILAGTRRIGFGLLIPGLPRPNDGLISVAETRLESAADSIALHVHHSGMLFSRACVQQIASFLRTGKFVHG